MTTDAGALAALRSSSFARTWLAGVVSGFGDKITLIALAYVSWQLTQSALSTSLAVVIATVPNALLGLFAGALADAVGHRRAMIACDLLRFALIGTIPLTLAAGAPLWTVFLIVLLSSVCGTVFRPARLSLVPELLPATRLGAGNSLMSSSDRVVEIGGALVAGGLVALIGRDAFYVDALTFVLSAALLFGIVVNEEPARRVSVVSVWQEARLGLRFLRGSAVLWSNTLFSLGAQLAIPVFNSLAPVLVFHDYGLGAAEFAVLEAAIAAGAVAATVVLPPLLSRFPKGRVMVAGFVANGALLVLIGLRPSFEVLLGLGVLSGVANILFIVPNITILQEASPPEFRARVFGSRIALLNLTWLPMIVLSGTLADTVGAPLLIAVAGAFTLFAAAIGALLPAVRDVP